MKVINWFKRLKIQYKLIIFNLALILVIFGCLLAIFYVFVFDTEVEKAINNQNVIAAKIGEQLDSIGSNMDRVALQLASTPWVIELFSEMPANSEGNYFTNEPLYSSQIVNLLNTFNIKKEMIARICLYNVEGDFIYSGSLPASEAALEHFFANPAGSQLSYQQDYFNNSYDSFSLFIPPRNDPFGVNGTYNENPQIFSFIRKVEDYSVMGQATALGYVEVQEPITKYTELFVDIPDNIIGFIADENGKIVYCTSDNVSQLLLENVGEKLPLQSKEGKISDGNDTWLMSVAQLKVLPGQVVLISSSNTVLSSLTSFGILLFLATVFTLIASALTISFGIKRLIKPLSNLHNAIDAASIDNPEWAAVTENENDELIKLDKAFKRLYLELQNSVDDLVAARTSEIKSQMNALQAQMDPHFIYNVIGIISMMANEGKSESISRICEKLSNILRYSASYKDSMVTIEQEVLNAENYLDLMEIRFEDNFSYSIKMDAEIISAEIPKFVLQPLVENAFKHGFKAKEPPWFIQIHVLENSRQWSISVEDNGTGFNVTSLSEFEEIKQTLNTNNYSNRIMELEIGKLSLINIYMRLRLVYGKDMIFTIENSKYGGAKITIGGFLDDSRISS